MVTRVGGLASGMDIDELVKKLMTAEKAPLNKLYQKKQTYEWQRDAYRSVNTKLKTFDTYIADNLVLKSLNSKTATSSNSNLVSVTATGKATGTLSIEGVSQLATNARALGEQVNAIGTTKLSDIGATGTIEIKAIQADGSIAKEATKIEITSDMTVNQFVSKVNSSSAGVSAVFENGRFSFTAKNSGENKSGDEIQVVSGAAIFEKLGFVDAANGIQTTDGKNAIFQVNGIATERSSNTFSISGYNVTLKETFNSEKTILDKYTAAKTELTNAQNNLTTKGQSFEAKELAYFGQNNVINGLKTYTVAHNTAYSTSFSNNTLNLSEQAEYSKLGGAFYRDLTTDEANLFTGGTLVGKTSAEIKSVIEGSNLSEESKNKLSKLSESQLQSLANLDSATLDKFKVQANYEKYGTQLKDLTPSAISQLKSLSIGEDDSIETIHAAIDAETAFSDELKTALKSLSKEDLKTLQDTEENTLKTYQNLAQADGLKQTYNKLGDKLISELTAAGITGSTDNLTTEQQTVWNKLNEDQKTSWNNLSIAEKTNFNNLAQQNIKRAEYVAADSELKSANTRLNTAIETEATAKADALAANVIDSNGNIIQSTIDNAQTAQAVTMTSTTNVDDMMAKIKEFVNTYNGFIKDLTDQTKETKYRDYAPLTDEQKEEMSENEIKLWEEKAKSGLLRNDSLIRNGLSNMRSLIYQSNPALEGSKYNTLFNIGITTSKNYNDGGTLEIDETKLRAALEEDPDAVEKLFKNSEGKKDDVVNGKTVDTRGYIDKLRESMKALEVNIEKKAGRSTMTDNQYSIGKSLVDAESRISTWKTKLENIEARYWKQFTAMETAINKANSQSSLFTQG